ncbi:MAG: MaoC family dehydratase, partial [Gammaproteobacteria bacterium]|nr:MaoC family dehydratase [Gammaproteobacteria bacterium]
MSDNKCSVIDFTVTADMVDAFARLSGDYNSMHVDPEIARKSRYRQPVVHGMIPFSFIQFLGSEFEGYDIEFIKLNTRFRKPVFINDAINLEITCTNTENEKKYNAVWRNKTKNEILITSKGEFRLINQTDSANNSLDTFLVSDITEARYHIDDLPDKREQLTFQVTDS